MHMTHMVYKYLSPCMLEAFNVVLNSFGASVSKLNYFNLKRADHRMKRNEIWDLATVVKHI